MTEKTVAQGSKLNFAFWFHLFITILAWVGTFLFSWYWMVAAHLIVQLQFLVLGRCLMNAQHGLDDQEDYIFYTFLFEEMGFRPNRKKLKKRVRTWLHPSLALAAIIWQVVLGFEPLLF